MRPGEQQPNRAGISFGPFQLQATDRIQDEQKALADALDYFSCTQKSTASAWSQHGNVDIDLSTHLPHVFTDQVDLRSSDVFSAVQTDSAIENSDTHNNDSGEIQTKTVIIAGSVAVTAFALFMLIKDIDINLGTFNPTFPGVGTTGPPKLDSKIDPLTYRTEGRFDMSANSQIEVGVGVTGFKEGYGIDVFGVTDSHFDKKIFGDVLLGADQTIINDTLQIDRQGDQILGIRATINAMDLFHPRVDMTELKNFLKIDADATQEEIDKIEQEFKEDGSHYDPTGGFDCGICSTDSMALKDGANFVAQYAISVDGHQPDIIFEATERYRQNAITQLASRYGVDPSLVKIDVIYGPGTDPNNPPSPAEVTKIYQQRMQEIYERDFQEDGQYLFKVKPEIRQNDDGSEYVFAKLIGGVELKVQLSGITYSEEIRGLIVQNIQEYDGPQSIEQQTSTTVIASSPPGLPPIVITSTTQPVYGPVYSPQNSQTPPTATTQPVYGPPFLGNTTTQG